MNEHQLRNHFEYLREQRLAEAERERMKRAVLRKAERQGRLNLSVRLGRSIGGVFARRRSSASASVKPVLLEDCVGLETP